MISTTEALAIGIMSIYTIIIVYGIHHYEARLKKLNNELDKHSILGMHKNEVANAHKQYDSLLEQNKVYHAQILRLQSEISELRSGMYTGYPAPTVGSFTTQMNEDTMNHYNKVNEVWKKGGMGIVNMDIISSEE